MINNDFLESKKHFVEIKVNKDLTSTLNTDEN